jgi:hypothetical protein
MAIITKPVGGIFKGIPATITLNKSELAALSSVSSDSYFSVTTNWNKVILSYKSFAGNQQEIVEFDAMLSSPTGFFDVSNTARNLFEIQVIKIIDFDGGIFIIPRSELITADFDVIFVSSPSSLSYTTPVIYTQNETITNNVPSVIGTVNSYSISPALPTGLTINSTTGIISGTPTAVAAAANYTVTASNSGGSTTAIVNITVEEESSEIGTYIDWTERDFYTPQADGGITSTLIGLDTSEESLIYGDNTRKNPNDGSFNLIYKLNKTDFINQDYRFLGITEFGKNTYTGFSKDVSVGPNGITILRQNSSLGNFTIDAFNDPEVTELILKMTITNDSVEYFVNGLKITELVGTSIFASSGEMIPAARVYEGMEVIEAYFEASAIVSTPVDWQESYNSYSSYYSFEPDGGLTTINTEVSYSPNYFFFSPAAFQISTNTIDFTSNFEVVFDLNTDFVFGQFVVGLTFANSQSNLIGISCWSSAVYYHVNEQISFYDDASTWAALNSVLNAETEKKIKIKKTGSLIEFYVGTTVVYSNTLVVAPTGDVKIVAYGSSPSDYFKGFSSVSYSV